MGPMSRTKIIITSGLIASLIAILFPPWIVSGPYLGVKVVSSLGYNFIFSPPEFKFSSVISPTINWQILLIEFLGIAILTGIALLITYKK